MFKNGLENGSTIIFITRLGILYIVYCLLKFYGDSLLHIITLENTASSTDVKAFYWTRSK